MRITYVGPVSVAKIAFLLYAAMGLIAGGMFAIFGVFGATAGAAAGDESAWLGAIFGIGAIIAMPLLYGTMGALMSLLMAWLYNIVAGVVGGVELRTERPS